MTSEGKSNWRLFILGFALPGFIVWLTYFIFVSNFFLQIFRFTAARAEFNRQFFSTDLAKSYPPIDLVILGDSTAKSAVNPLQMHYLFGVNLAANGGTALAAYQTLDRFLRAHPKPKCVLYVSQYNWSRSYTYFFERIVFYRALDFINVFNIWWTGVQNGIYPRTEYSTAGYFLASLRYYLFLGELPLNLIQKAVDSGLFLWKPRYENISRQMIINRGFQNNELRKVQSEEKFFTDDLHGALNAPFTPYAAEDFYIRAMIERSQKEGIKFLWAMLPWAESDHLVAASVHQRDRDIHLLRMMQNRPNVIQIPLPLSLPRKYFFDFTHMIPEGARRVQPYLDPSLQEFCASAG